MEDSLLSLMIVFNTLFSIFSNSLEVVVGTEVVIGCVVTVDCVVMVGGEIRSLTVDISRLRMVETFAPKGVNRKLNPPN